MVQQLEGEGDQLIMVNRNCAYNTFDHQVPTVNNMGYGQIQSNCYSPVLLNMNMSIFNFIVPTGFMTSWYTIFCNSQLKENENTS